MIEQIILRLKWMEDSEYCVNIVFEMLNRNNYPIYICIPFILLEENVLVNYTLIKIQSAFQSNENVAIKDFNLIVRLFRIPGGHSISI